MHAEPAAKRQEEKVTCPLSKIVMRGSECPVGSCLWNNKNKCGYTEAATETDLALQKGIPIDNAFLESRRAKSAIQRVLVLDKYIDWVRSNATFAKKEQVKDNLEKDVLLNSFKDKTLAWSNLFHMNMCLFVEVCRKRNYRLFVKKNPAISSYRLESLLGLREGNLKKIESRYRSLVRRKITRSGSDNTNTKKVT